MSAGCSWLRTSHLIAPSVVALVVILWPARADAYTWMIRHGYGGCVTCHTDPSGGELLTPYGRVQSDLILRMRYGKDSVSAQASETGSSGSFDSFDSFDEPAGKAQAKPEVEEAPADADASAPSDSSGFLWGLVETPDWLLLGGSSRTVALIRPSLANDQLSVFPMQADLYGQVQFGSVRAGGSIGASKVPAGSPHARAAQVTTNQGDEYNLISRTHWVGFDVGDAYTVRAGRLNLPYGIRIPEHVMWARDATRTDRESDQQHGLALAYNGSFLRAEVMAIAGNYQISPDEFRERGYSLYLEALLEDWAIGVSSLITSAKIDRVFLVEQTTVRQAHGLFARVAPVQQLAILIEVNGLVKSRTDPGYVGFLQADFEAVQGLHFMLTGEILNDNLRSADGGVPGDEATPGIGEPKLGGWATVDWFFLPHLEFRLDGIARQEDPFAIMGQLHVFL